MILALLTPFLILFVIGAKASIENERGQINWLLERGVPKWAITVVFFVLFPYCIWNGWKVIVFNVRFWLAYIALKRTMRRVMRKLSEAHKGNAEVQKDLKELADLTKNL